VTERKQNCHLVLPILRSCVIIQDDNVIGRQDPLGWQLAWSGRRALKEAGMTVMFPPKPPAPHFGARHRCGRVLTAVPTSPVSRFVGTTNDDDDEVQAADALLGMVRGAPAKPPGRRATATSTTTRRYRIQHNPLSARGQCGGICPCRQRSAQNTSATGAPTIDAHDRPNQGL
jgi:hypothetical protein